jgi:hypothetical protein
MEEVRGKVIVVVETQDVADLLDGGEQLTVVEGQQEENDIVQDQGQGQEQEQLVKVEEQQAVVEDVQEHEDIVPL